MEQDNQNRNESVYSRKIRAGRRRTYFFDVRTTRGSDFYLTITESKKKFQGDGYERHKIFLYKEDFNKFIEELANVVDFIKEKMPDFDFDAFNHKYEERQEGSTDYEKRLTKSSDRKSTVDNEAGERESDNFAEDESDTDSDMHDEEKPEENPANDSHVETNKPEEKKHDGDDDLKW